MKDNLTNHIMKGNLTNHIALVIKNQKNEILFIQRSKNKKTLLGAWSFPSGTLELNELPRETAIREAEEELGIKVNPIEILSSIILSEFSVKLAFMLCTFDPNSKPTIKQPGEIEKLEWMTFQDFFNRLKDNEIGHGLIWLRKNTEIWESI